MKLIRALAPLLLLLSACAPSVTGASPVNPVEVIPGEPVELVQGDSVYLGLEYELDAFGMSPSALSGLFWVPAGVDAESANLMTRFMLDEVMVPFGWSLQLERIRAERREETRFGRESTTTSYGISAVLLLQVPPDANLGVTEVRARLTPRDAQSAAVTVPVRVRAPAHR